MQNSLVGPLPGTVFRIGDFGARGRARQGAPKGDGFLTRRLLADSGNVGGAAINVNADSFVAGSQEDPAAVAAEDAARDLARWPDRPGPSPVACG